MIAEARRALADQFNPIGDVLDHLRGNASALSLASVYAPARAAVNAWPWPMPRQTVGAYEALLDSAKLTGDALEDLIFDACQLYGLDRGDGPELVDVVRELGL